MFFQRNVQHKKYHCWFFILLFFMYMPQVKADYWPDWIPTTIDKTVITYGIVGLAVLYLGSQLLSDSTNSKTSQNHQARGSSGRFRSRSYQQQSNSDNSSMMTQLSVGALLTAFGVVASNGLQSGGPRLAGGNKFEYIIDISPDDLVASSEKFSNIRSRAERAGSDLPPMIILYGEPGTGKSLGAKVIALDRKGKTLRLRGSDIASTYQGASTKIVGDLFDEAFQIVEESDQRVTVIIDEIESFIPPRKNLGDNAAANDKRAQVNEFATRIESIGDAGLNGKILIIGTTNDQQLVGPIFNGRPGRCEMLEITMPGVDQRKEILEHFFSKHCAEYNIALPDQEALNKLAKEWEGVSGDCLRDCAYKSVIAAKEMGRKKVSDDIINTKVEEVCAERKKNLSKESGLPNWEYIRDKDHQWVIDCGGAGKLTDDVNRGATMVRNIGDALSTGYSWWYGKPKQPKSNDNTESSN